MISSIGVIERRSASEHKSEIEFEFGVVVELSCCLSSSAQAPTSV